MCMQLLHYRLYLLPLYCEWVEYEVYNIGANVPAGGQPCYVVIIH